MVSHACKASYRTPALALRVPAAEPAQDTDVQASH